MAKLIRRPVLATFALGQHKCVSTADDECIVHYMQANSQGARHVSVDKDNNVWLSGYGLHYFDLVKGGRWSELGSGQLIRSENYVFYGGYGGLVGTDGAIWSTTPLLRWNPTGPLTAATQSFPPGNDVGPPGAGTFWAGSNSFHSSGLCIDKTTGDVWASQSYGNDAIKYDKDGRYIGAYPQGNYFGRGCVVDGNGDVWVALERSSTIGHLQQDGTYVGYVDLVDTSDNFIDGDSPTNVAVDALGKIWASNSYSHSLSRIDPQGNGGIGAVDMTVDLGAECYQYPLGDMTGSRNLAPPNTGSWTVTHDISNVITRRKIDWTSLEPLGSLLEVLVRDDTAAAWNPVTNGQEISHLAGPSLYVQVRFTRVVGGASPVLFDLSLVAVPDNAPSAALTAAPTKVPIHVPTKTPTRVPTTRKPTMTPTTRAPTKNQTTRKPTKTRTTRAPTKNPTIRKPTKTPTTRAPTKKPKTS